MKKFIYKKPFITESGEEIPSLEIAYHTWGSLNESRSNVIWVCHALTANSDVASWWPGMVGSDCLFDPASHFIVCANIPGSCYGSTGPLSINPQSGEPWYHSFPILTIRDVVNALELLRLHLGITTIKAMTGASVGGQQALEYAIMFPSIVRKVIFIASNARQSPWAVAFNESQRLALEADPSFRIRNPHGGREGLKAARAVALLSYRNQSIYNNSQRDCGDSILHGFRAASYQAYQGEKLVQRFNPWSYYRLTQMADSHNVGRGRGGVKEALKKVKAEVLGIGISSDILYPPDDIRRVTDRVAKSEYCEIDSHYGHDGFLTEPEKITAAAREFISDRELVLEQH